MADHLKKVSEELKRLAKDGRAFYFIIGGIDRTAQELLETLPESVAKNFIGSFPVSHKHATEAEILSDAELAWKNYDQGKTHRLVDQLFDAAKSGGKGVLGVDSTLSALTEEKVQTLLLIDGVEISGSVCSRCDYFSAEQFAACPPCGGKADQRDLTDRAVEKAILTGADTQIVSGDDRDRLLDEGGVGALLRY